MGPAGLRQCQSEHGQHLAVSGCERLPEYGDGDWLNNNIRTGLFIAPIGRMTQVQNILDMSYSGTKPETKTTNHKQIPWIARFNNFGNSSLDNANLPGLSYVFDAILFDDLDAERTEIDRRPAARSRRRECDGAPLPHAWCVLGEPVRVRRRRYSQTDFQNDVRDGWKGDARLNNIMAAGRQQTRHHDAQPTVDGISNSTRAEQTGTIWSGQYSSMCQIRIPESQRRHDDPRQQLGFGGTPDQFRRGRYQHRHLHHQERPGLHLG
jgi:hypothetical protein